jgi:hypothetical protein
MVEKTPSLKKLTLTTKDVGDINRFLQANISQISSMTEEELILQIRQLIDGNSNIQNKYLDGKIAKLLKKIKNIGEEVTLKPRRGNEIGRPLRNTLNEFTKNNPVAKDHKRVSIAVRRRVSGLKKRQK